jgi:cytochrome c
MPRKLLVLLSSLLFLAATPKSNTRAAVKAWVEDAAKYVAKHGPDCATLESKAWRSGDYYIFVAGADEKLICHANASMIGTDVNKHIDANGKHLGTALLAAAKKGGGWVDYVWPRPGSTKPIPKSSYEVQVKGPGGKTYYVGGGGYELK